jgi:peptidoglycan/LPS O-acetylase OafA/YrhL
LGVRVFFVLSGFLITQVLGSIRSRAKESSGELLYGTRQFFVRRTLRIWPIYYLALATGWAFNCGPADAIPWLATFTGNWWIAIRNEGMACLTPYWSLAIEEQFYLIWPWLILFLPLRWVFPITALTIVCSVALRVYASSAGWHWWWIYTSTFTATDALAYGALLAWLKMSRHCATLDAARIVGGVAGVAMLVVAQSLLWFYPARFGMIAEQINSLGAVLWGGALILAADAGIRGFLGKCLDAEPTVYLGKISYSIYVWHMIVYGIIQWCYEHFGFDWSYRKDLRQLGIVLAGLFVAAVSYRFIETPINDLKRFFPYSRRAVGS